MNRRKNLVIALGVFVFLIGCVTLQNLAMSKNKKNNLTTSSCSTIPDNYTDN